MSSTEAARERNLYVPIAESGGVAKEAVVINVDQLPPDEGRILDVLMPESAPLALFLQFGVEYLKRGQASTFLSVLNVAIGDEANEVYDATHNAARVAILCALAAYHTRLGEREAAGKRREASQRSPHFVEATRLLNRATALNQADPSVFVGKALLTLAKGDRDGGAAGSVKEALQNFAFALDQDQRNVPALVGVATCKYAKGDWQGALKHFLRALKASPEGPASVRLGLGFCLFRLRNYTAARQAFERVLEFGDADRAARVQARTALAVLNLNRPRQEGLREALELLEAAHADDPECPQVLVRLADHFFYTREYARAVDLAQRASRLTRSGDLKAEADFQVARAFHAQDDHDRAFSYYKSATKHRKDHTLACVGLGQLHLRRGDLDSAIAALQPAERAHPEDVTVAKLAGEAYVRARLWDKAQAVAERARRAHPEDADVALLAGRAAEATQPAAAAECYQDAARLLRAAGRPVPFHLWNNVGNLFAMAGRHGEAEDAYLLALGPGGAPLTGLRDAFLPPPGPPAKVTEESRGELERGECEALRVRPVGGAGDAPEPELPRLEAHQATVAYNLAMLYASRAEHGRAAAVFKALLRSHPAYTDAYLRLGDLEMERHAYKHAAAWYARAQLFDDKCAEAELLLGQMYTAMVDAAPDGSPDATRLLKMAASHFDRALRAERKAGQKAGGAFSRLGMADAWFRQGSSEKAFKAALDVLKGDGGNVYAANGAAVSMACAGHFAQAKAAFASVREAAGETPGLWINQAHTMVRLGQLDAALKIYQHVLARFAGYRTVDVLTYVANAHFVRLDYLACKDAMTRAIRLSPQNLRLWYNLAVAQEEYCIQVLQKDVASRSSSEVNRAVRELGLALRTFARLPSQARAEGAKVNARGRRSKEKDKEMFAACAKRKKELDDLAARSTKHHEFCLDVMEKAQPHVQSAASQERLAEERARDAARAREEASRRLERAREEKRLAEEARLAERARERENSRRALERMKREWAEAAVAEEEAEAEASSKKRKRKKGDDDFIDDADAEGNEEYAPGDRLGEDEPAPAAGANDAEEEEEAEANFTDEDDDAAAPGGKRKRGDGGDGKKRKKKRLTKKSASDDEDESDAAGGGANGHADAVDGGAGDGRGDEDEEDDDDNAAAPRPTSLGDDEEEEEDKKGGAGGDAEPAAKKRRVIAADDDEEEEEVE